MDVPTRMGASVELSEDGTTVTGPERLRGDSSVEMGGISDTFMSLACVAPFADGPVHIQGIAHTRLKECDRIEVVAQNLRRCGVTVEDGPDWIRIHPLSLPARSSRAIATTVLQCRSPCSGCVGAESRWTTQRVSARRFLVSPRVRSSVQGRRSRRMGRRVIIVGAGWLAHRVHLPVRHRWLSRAKKPRTPAPRSVCS